MEWLSCIRTSIRYMEEHLLTIRDSSEVADAVFVSPYYLQKGFKLMTGYSMAEYIRKVFPKHFRAFMAAHRQG